MTGEITLRGRVWPIAGLKEKLLAALRGGIKTVLIREENAKDLVEISESIKSGLEIVPVSHGRGARPRDDAQAGADRVGRDFRPIYSDAPAHATRRAHAGAKLAFS
jgi:hypothetical protein